MLVPIPFIAKPVAAGGYTLQLVDNQGSASYGVAGSFASDSVYFWVSGHFNFQNDGSTEEIFEVGARSTVIRQGQSLAFSVKNTTGTVVLDVNLPAIAAGGLTHVLLTYDGTASTGGWAAYIDGVDVTGSSTVNTAWASATVDHTRGQTDILAGVDTIIGDLMLGNGAPPAIGDVYPAQDISGVTATVKLSGDATVWNAGPAGYTVSGTFVDA